MRKSLAFSAAIVIAYFCAILPVLIHRDFDASIFIVAGDRFVDPAKVASPVVIRKNDAGYDGQFYYRLAVAPFSLQQQAFGVAFDAPAYRMQRIGYPLLAWALSVGQTGWVPTTLVFVNLLGLAAVAFFSWRVSVRLSLHRQTAWLIVLWPGFIVTLMHDTTEIVATALLLAALDSYFTRQMLRFGVLAAIATLTREVGILALAGILFFEAIRFWRDGFTREAGLRVLICGAALVPFLLWNQTLKILWDAPHARISSNLGWPFVGPLEAIKSIVAGTRMAMQGRHPWMSTAFDTAGVLCLLAFCALVLWRVFALRRAGDTIGPLVFAWAPLFALMMCLTAIGPWVDPTAYFRAFTECFVVGSLILFTQPQSKVLRGLVLVGAALLWIGAWAQTSAIAIIPPVNGFVEQMPAQAP